MIKGIIFDFDMTLVDSLWIGKRAAELLEKNHGISSKGLSLKEAFGMSFYEFCKKLAELNSYKMSFEEISKLDLYYMQDGFRMLELNETELLKYLLDKGIKLGIISHGRLENIELVVNRFKEEIKFDFIYSANDNIGKDKSVQIKEALEFWKIDKKECMYVGDHINDVIAGKKSGVVSVGVASGLHTIDELKEYGPDILLENLTELKKYV